MQSGMFCDDSVAIRPISYDVRNGAAYDVNLDGNRSQTGGEVGLSIPPGGLTAPASRTLGAWTDSFFG